MARRRRTDIRRLYRILLGSFGPQHWWPASHPFEIMVGAILTQATNWRNVERAIKRLRRIGALAPRRMISVSPRRLASAVRPAGYFRQKTERLRIFTKWFVERYGGSPSRMFRRPWRRLRAELLALRGIGQETADSILLYAGGRPVFVVDAYTRRVFRRHMLVDGNTTDEGIRRLVSERGSSRASWYNEFHALIVALGKKYCHRRSPECGMCPLGDLPRRIEPDSKKEG